MYKMKPFILCMAIVFLIACAGQPVKNSTQPTGTDINTSDENLAKQWEPENKRSEWFNDRGLDIMADVLIAALVVTEVCLFWYWADQHHDSGEVFLWVDPFGPF